MASSNADLKRILARAIAACVAASFDAETVKHSDNPAWIAVVEVLDNCTDEMRDIEYKLSGTQGNEAIADSVTEE